MSRLLAAIAMVGSILLAIAAPASAEPVTTLTSTGASADCRPDGTSTWTFVDTVGSGSGGSVTLNGAVTAEGNSGPVASASLSATVTTDGTSRTVTLGSPVSATASCGDAGESLNGTFGWSDGNGHSGTATLAWTPGALTVEGIDIPDPTPTPDPTPSPSDPTPTDPATGEPTDGPTDPATGEPTDGPTDGPTDPATGEPTDPATGTPAPSRKLSFRYRASWSDADTSGSCRVTGANLAIRCTDVQSVKRTLDGLTIFGTATINGVATTFTIKVHDGGPLATGNDRFTILTGTGYRGGGQLTSGDLRVR